MSAAPIYGSKGAFGPVLTLIYTCPNITEQRAQELIDLTEKNFVKLAKRQPEGKKAFEEYVFTQIQSGKALDVSKATQTVFLQSMQGKLSKELREKVMEYTVPSLMADVDRKLGKLKESSEEHKGDSSREVLSQWIAGNLAAVRNEQELLKQYRFQKLLGPLEDNCLRQKRNLLGSAFYARIKDKDLTDKDFNLFVDMLKGWVKLVKQADHPKLVADFSLAYLSLGRGHDKSIELIDALSDAFDDGFRKML